MTPSEIISGMRDKNLLLTQKNDEYKDLMGKKAEAERDYSLAYRKELMALALAGEPVTIRKEIAKGSKAVSDLKYTLDVLEGLVKACRESLENIRIAIDSYRSILTWQREELHRS